MKKNILLSGILLLSFSCAVAQDYHDDVVVLDSVKVMSSIFVSIIRTILSIRHGIGVGNHVPV